jgi:hypothetical protein
VSFVHKYQINGTDNQQESQDVVPMQMGALEHDVGNDAEYCQRYTLLYHLQLYEVKGTTILNETKTVGWYLTTVLEEGDAPREGYDSNEGPVVGNAVLLEF